MKNSSIVSGITDSLVPTSLRLRCLSDSWSVKVLWEYAHCLRLPGLIQLSFEQPRRPRLAIVLL